MALEFPFSFEDLDLLRVAAGFFVMLIVFGILQKSKVIGKNKAINLLVSLAIGIYVLLNERVSGFILDFSSNAAFLIIFALVIAVLMVLANISALAIFIIFIIATLFLVGTSIYPFYLVLDYVSADFLKTAIIFGIVIVLVLLLLGKRK
ncbi:hypothetical protein J4231_03210 [Candidatus Woesearchaeota archaeon]|nr:hypothetical protein [Candidatus Woesearchaeota archaeon]